jgi:hypothetical protein
MRNLPTYTANGLICLIRTAGRAIILLFIPFFLLLTAQYTYAQQYFSPNPKVVTDQKKAEAFIKATPEITLKAEFYNVSKAVLETVLLLQSNAGTTISDGLFNYGRVLTEPQLTGYPAFSKSKGGFILCTTRSRGVEATALSLSLLRNDGKNSLTDAQWLNLVFGPGGILRVLSQKQMQSIKAEPVNLSLNWV